MEKTNFNKTSGVFDETTQMTSKWLSEACSSMMNIYDKQLKTTMGFYNNLFNTFSQPNKEGFTAPNFISPFFSGNEAFRPRFNPFNVFGANGSFFNSFTSQLENFNKQLSDFNNNLFNILQDEFKNKEGNWNEIKEKYNKLVEERWKANMEIANFILDNYTKQLTYSLELNKKIISEMNAQFEQANARNKKFWSEYVKTARDTEKTEREEDTERKDGQTKKQSKTVEFANND